MERLVLRLKGLVEGAAEGPLLVYPARISFYGEVDPATGLLKPSSTTLEGRILVFRGTRGSTVAPYILYALSKNHRGPAGLVVEKAEPMLVTGAVLAETPLAEGLDETSRLRRYNGCPAKLHVDPPRATLELVICQG